MSNVYIRDRFEQVKKNAYRIISDKDLMNKHLWRTKPCKYGLTCSKIETCCGAHFKCEYRVPVCLYQEFCEKKNCEFYHAHMGTEKEYMEFMKIEFQYNTPEECLADTARLQSELDKKKIELEKKFILAQNTRPLVKAPVIVNPTHDEKKNDPRSFTRLCRHMKSNRPCKFSACTFAHSVEQLVLPTCDRTDCTCLRLHKGEDKALVAERVLDVKIHAFMLRPTWMNNAYLKELKDQEEFFEIERRIEMENSQSVSEPPQISEPQKESPVDQSDQSDGKYDSDEESESEELKTEENEEIDVNKKYFSSPFFDKKYCIVVDSWGDEEYEDE